MTRVIFRKLSAHLRSDESISYPIVIKIFLKSHEIESYIFTDYADCCTRCQSRIYTYHVSVETVARVLSNS